MKLDRDINELFIIITLYFYKQTIETLQRSSDFTFCSNLVSQSDLFILTIKHRTGAGVTVDLESKMYCGLFSPQEKLARSMARMSRAIQQTRAGRKQLQQDYQCSLEQVARLEAQLNQGKDNITDLEAQVTLGQEQVAQLEAQLICREDRKQNPDWRQAEELETLRARLQKSQSRNKRNQQKWVSTS